VDFGVFHSFATRRATALGARICSFSKPHRTEKAALKFAEFVLSEEFQTEWAIGTGYLPVNLLAPE